MRQLLVIGLAMGLVSAAGAFVLVHDVPDSVEANHSTPGSVDTHIVHAHDDYFHPEPLTGPWPNHTAAQTDCQAASPAPQCNMTIDAGDSVEWWTKAPFHVNPHTVTECTDGSFTVCGAAVDPANPIGDSGVFPGGASSNTLRYGPITFATAGSYFYRCDVHPDVMRGRIVVQMVGTPPAGPPAVGGVVGLSNDGGAPASPGMDGGSNGWLWLAGSAAVAVLVIIAGGASLWNRVARRPVEVEDPADHS
jgi:plastocyanin